MLLNTLPDPYSGARKSSVAVGWESGRGNTVHETKRNADAFETPTLLDDEDRQQGMMVPGHENICTPNQIVHGVYSLPAWYKRTNQYLLQEEFKVKCNNPLLDNVQCSSIVLGRQLSEYVGTIVLPHSITECFSNYITSQKMDPFSFEHNFRKHCPILIILSLMQTKINCD